MNAVRRAIQEYRRRFPGPASFDLHYRHESELLYPSDTRTHRVFAGAGAAGDRWRRRQSELELRRSVTESVRRAMGLDR